MDGGIGTGKRDEDAHGLIGDGIKHFELRPFFGLFGDVAGGEVKGGCKGGFDGGGFGSFGHGFILIYR